MVFVRKKRTHHHCRWNPQLKRVRMKYLTPLAPYVHWGLRASVAATYFFHGSQKFPPTALAANVGLPIAVAWLVAFAEIGAALCLLGGAFTRDIVTRLGGLLVVTNMLGAILLVHASGWDYRTGGMEFQVLLLVVGFYFEIP